MAIFFVRESEEKNSFKLLFKNVKKQMVEDKNIFILPINKNKKLTKKQTKRIILELIKEKAHRVVLSNYLNSIVPLKVALINNNIFIIDGKELFKILLEDIIKYICKKKDVDINKIKLSVLVNDYNIINKKIIIDLAKLVKSLSIVTKEQQNMIDIEDYLFNEMGIIIKFYNNIEKNSNIIINFDFDENEFKNYNISNKSIIINTNGNMKIEFKKFNGININNLNIKVPNKYKINEFEDKLIYEGCIIGKDYEQMREQIKKDKIEIVNLIGEKGIIYDQEFKK